MAEDLENIVGKENVLKDPEALKAYSGKGPGKKPVSVVRPANIDELQGVVKWANENKVPLVPVSSGPPHFRGDSSPSVDGAVVVDMRRMKKILRVNRDNRVAIVEPGVTFGELQTELAKSGLSAYMPLLPRASKSVIASVLEREPIMMPSVHFDSTDPMLCIETVFGSGDRMRTGEAAGPDTLEQQWEIGKAQISPFGPTQMDPQRLISGAQGTIGIVTWMSIKCRIKSELTRSFFITSSELEPLVDLSYYLTRVRFTGRIFIVNGTNLASLARVTSQDITAVREKLPAWVMFVGFEGYGPLPEEKIEYLEADLRELTEKRSLDMQTEIAGIKAGELYKLLSMPSTEPYWKQRLKGDFKDIFFLTPQGRTPEYSAMVKELAGKQNFPAGNIGVYIQPVAQGTSCHCEYNFYYDSSNQAEAGAVDKLEALAVDKLEEKGAFFSRPYQGWVDVAYRRSLDTAEMQKKVKDIFDPNWILNPGKLCFK